MLIAEHASKPALQSRSRNLARGHSTYLALFIQGVLLIGAIGAWTNYGVNLGFQTLSVIQAASVLAFALTFFNGLILRPQSIQLFGFLLVPSIFVIIAAVASMVNARDTFDAIRFLGRYIYGLMFVFALVAMADNSAKLARLVVQMFLLGGCATTLVCLAANYNDQLAEIVFQDLFSKRTQGFLSHPNQLAMVYLVSVVLLFWPRILPLYLRIAAFVLLFGGLLITGSKFNLVLGALATVMQYIWLPLREGKQIKAFANIALIVPLAFVVGTAAALIIQMNSSIYYERMIAFFEDPANADTTNIRFEIWNVAYECFEKHTFVGIGAGNAQQCIPFSHAHNFIVNYLLEMGLAGLFGLSLLMIGIFAILRRANQTARKIYDRGATHEYYRATGTIIVGVSAFLVSNLSSDSLGPATMPTLWMLIALAIAISSVSTKHVHSAGAYGSK